MMRCVFCGIHRDYYGSDENASRQNCLFSDSGYHYFVHFPLLHLTPLLIAPLSHLHYSPTLCIDQFYFLVNYPFS